MNIKIYQDENGNNPYLRWLGKLKDRQTQLKIEKRLAQLRLGHLGDFKNLGTGSIA